MHTGHEVQHEGFVRESLCGACGGKAYGHGFRRAQRLRGIDRRPPKFGRSLLDSSFGFRGNTRPIVDGKGHRGLRNAQLIREVI